MVIFYTPVSGYACQMIKLVECASEHSFKYR